MGRKPVESMRDVFKEKARSSPELEIQPQRIVYMENGDVLVYFDEEFFSLILPETAQRLIAKGDLEVVDQSLNVESGVRVRRLRTHVGCVIDKPANRNNLSLDGVKAGDLVLMVNQLVASTNGVFKLSLNRRYNTLKAGYLPCDFMAGDKLLDRSTGNYWVLDQGKWRPLKASDVGRKKWDP